MEGMEERCILPKVTQLTEVTKLRLQSAEVGVMGLERDHDVPRYSGPDCGEF